MGGGIKGLRFPLAESGLSAPSKLDPDVEVCVATGCSHSYTTGSFCQPVRQPAASLPSFWQTGTEALFQIKDSLPLAVSYCACCDLSDAKSWHEIVVCEKIYLPNCKSKAHTVKWCVSCCRIGEVKWSWRGATVTQHNRWINGPVRRRKGQQRIIDMFNKLALMTAGVIVHAALGSARHMAANRHDIAACPDLSIPSQWH